MTGATRLLVETDEGVAPRHPVGHDPTYVAGRFRSTAGKPLPFASHHSPPPEQGGFEGWACLDSNQGPLPYQRRRPTSAVYRHVRKYGFSKLFSLPRPQQRFAEHRRVSPGLVSALVSNTAQRR